MKHFSIFLLLSLLFFVEQKANAQNIWGKATYEAFVELGDNFGRRNMNEADKAKRKKEIEESLRNSFTLTFNASSSIYKINPKVETSNGPRFMMAMMASSTAKVVYKNAREQSYKEQAELYGKLFLIEDSLSSNEWKLEEETKMIGDFLCLKATLLKTIPVRFRPRRRGGEVAKEQKQTEEIVVTAWYTLDVPISQGPAGYWGLPGLIMEVNDSRTTLICTGISLQKEALEIKIPKKGKKVSKEEYQLIQRKKMKEMRDNWRQNRPRRN